MLASAVNIYQGRTMFEKSINNNRRNISTYQNLLTIYQYVGSEEHVAYVKRLMKENF